MTILPELEAQILRYYHVEKWRTGTIAAQLGVHHGTVTRILAQAGLPKIGAPRRASAIDPSSPNGTSSPVSATKTKVPITITFRWLRLQSSAAV